jgi:bifunctional non-homologous end joining protein LigD
MTDKIPFRVEPMLPTFVSKPFDKPVRIYEEKYDGYRILAYKEGSKVTLLSRNGKDRTETYPDLAAAIETLPASTLLLDGEIVAFDKHRVSRFQLLQEGKAVQIYAVSDCLFLDRCDLRAKPLSVRRGLMEEAIRGSKRHFPSQRMNSNGLLAFREAQTKGYEGVVAKDLGAPYIEGRTRRWLKFKVHQEDEFVIAGYTRTEGSRAHFGALLLGAYRRGHLQYVGKVGTGFSRELLASLFQKFQPLIRKKTVLIDPPRDKGVTYLTPRLVAQIAYQELTAEQKLRQPVFLGLRNDKDARHVYLPGEAR